MAIFKLIKTSLGNLGESYGCPVCGNEKFKNGMGYEEDQNYTCEQCGLVQSANSLGLIASGV